MAKQPDPGAIRFVDRIEDSVAVTVITVAEIGYGIAVLPADAEIAAARRRAGKLISQADGIIAAICRHHEVAL